MINLVLAIACSALIALLMRLSENHIHDKLPMLSVNYVTCLALGAVYTRQDGWFPAHPMLGTVVALGAVCGLLYLNSFVLLQWNVEKNGVVLSSVFMKLGILVPTLMSIVVFGETPSAAQLTGFALALAAIVLINLEKQPGGEGSTLSRAGLMVLLLSGGLSDGMSKIFERVGTAELESQYLLYTFLVALVLCAALSAVKKNRLGWQEILFGVLIGIPNYYSAKFLLRSLTDIPAVVAFPSYSVGTIVVITLSGVVFFHEKLSRRQLAGMGVIALALVLLNV